MSATHPDPLRVAFLGFSDTERSSLASYFKLAAHRVPHFRPVYMLTDADYLVADADHGPSVQLVLITDRLAETVFIGSQSPPGAAPSLRRPIDALLVLRALEDLARPPDAGPDTISLTLTDDGPDTTPAASPDAGPDTIQDPETDSARTEPRLAILTPAVGRPPSIIAAAMSAASPQPPLPVPPPPAAPPPPRQPLRPAAMPAGPLLAAAPGGTVPQPLPRARPPALERPALPAAAASPHAGRPGQVARKPVSSVGVPPPLRALLVDDSAIALRFLESRLKSWGLETDAVATSQLALELLGQRSYELIFLDLELGPGSELDGLTLCRQIRNSAAAVHSVIVIVSAHHSEIDRARGSLAGCDEYLAKPLKETELARLLQHQGLAPPPQQPGAKLPQAESARPA